MTLKSSTLYEFGTFTPLLHALIYEIVFLHGYRGRVSLTQQLSNKTQHDVWLA